MGADLRTPFNPNCSEGSMAKPDEDGHYPVKIATPPQRWPSYEGHISADCSFDRIPEGLSVLPCPECLRSHLASFPERYHPIDDEP